MEYVPLAYGLTAVSFVAGLVVVLALLRSIEGSPHRRTLAALAVIPGFAGLAYAAMALGIGTVTIDGDQFVGFRYLDWLVTTPLLIGFVGYVASASRRAIAATMLADALMILTGAGATVVAAPAKWALFAVSGGFHLSLFAALYVVFPRSLPDTPSQKGLFSLLKNHIGLLWLAYPFVWVASPAGLGYATAGGTALTFAFLDVLAKVPYVMFFYARRRVFTGAVDTQMTGERTSATPAD